MCLYASAYRGETRLSTGAPDVPNVIPSYWNSESSAYCSVRHPHFSLRFHGRGFLLQYWQGPPTQDKQFCSPIVHCLHERGSHWFLRFFRLVVRYQASARCLPLLLWREWR